MIAIGVDPGTRNLGWGIVHRSGNRLRHIAHGVIRLDARLALADRLARIDEELTQVIAHHRPEVGSVESLFFHKDAQAAAKLGHARGVVLLGLARAGVGVVEYAPAKVKRTLTGNGQADKRQVAEMIRAVLCLDRAPASDAADALALAVTHLRIGPLADALASKARLDPRQAEVLASLSQRRVGGRARRGRARGRAAAGLR